MIDNRNMILAVILSIAILVGFEMFFAKTRPAPSLDSQVQPGQTLSTKKLLATPNASGPQMPGSLTAAPSSAAPNIPSLPTSGQIKPRQNILKQSPQSLY